MNDYVIAITLAAVFSILICIIEVKYDSKVWLRCCLNSATLLYLIILIVGNTATTLIAAASTQELFVKQSFNQAVKSERTSNESTSKNDIKPLKASTSKTNTGTKKLPFPWFWYAFGGVFGFQGLIKRINVTFSDIGILSINDWINMARESAVATAIEKQADFEMKRVNQIANRLKEMDEATLNAQVLNILGQERLAELDTIANNTNSDSRLTKALALAHASPDQAGAIST